MIHEENRTSVTVSEFRPAVEKPDACIHVLYVRISDLVKSLSLAQKLVIYKILTFKYFF